MDRRVSYAAGDLLANVLLGALVGLVCWAIVGQWWNMWVAMFAMMPVGAFLGMVSFFLVARWLGAMEAMVPLMFTGEMTGMVVGMAAAMMPASPAQAMLWGAGCGAACMAVIWVLNTLLRGVTRDGRENAHG